MKRTVLAGLAALALLLAGSLAVVLGTTTDVVLPLGPPDAEMPASAPVRPPEESRPQAEPSRVEAPGSVADPVPAAPAGELFRRLARQRLPRGSPAPADLFAGLRALAASLEHCARRSGAAPAGRSSRTTLLLELETAEGKVSIVDVRPQARGADDDETIRCAREELLGREIVVSVAHAGTAFQVPMPLPP